MELWGSKYWKTRSQGLILFLQPRMTGKICTDKKTQKKLLTKPSLSNVNSSLVGGVAGVIYSLLYSHSFSSLSFFLFFYFTVLLAKVEVDTLLFGAPNYCYKRLDWKVPPV